VQSTPPDLKKSLVAYSFLVRQYLEMLSRILNRYHEWRAHPWQPLSLHSAIAWQAVYALFLVHAFRNTSGFLLIDNANLVVHEGGHLLFGWFGETLGLYGGTLLQLLVPFALAASFAYRRHTAGTAFYAFFFFENFLYTATYMADARVQELPLVSVGSDEAVGHDWERIFSGLGLLQHDTQIASLVRLAGWGGMLLVAGWLAWRAWQDHQTDQARAASA
jgi:hypothetical protein